MRGSACSCIGALQRARGCEGDEQSPNPAADYESCRRSSIHGAFDPVSGSSPGCGHEAYHHHERARRFRDVRFEDFDYNIALERRIGRTSSKRLPRVPEEGAAPFSTTHSSTGIIPTFLPRPHWSRCRRPSRSGPLHRLHERPASRAVDELRRDRRHPVRRVVGPFRGAVVARSQRRLITSCSHRHHGANHHRRPFPGGHRCSEGSPGGRTADFNQTRDRRTARNVRDHERVVGIQPHRPPCPRAI